MKILHFVYTAIIVSFLVFGCAGSKTSNITSELSDNLQSPISDTNADSKLLAQADSEAEADQGDDEEGEDGKDADAPEDAKNSATPSGEESLLDTALELTVRSQELWSAGETEKAIEALDHADPPGPPRAGR